jgi:hypothetical protein
MIQENAINALPYKYSVYAHNKLFQCIYHSLLHLIYSFFGKRFSLKTAFNCTITTTTHTYICMYLCQFYSPRCAMWFKSNVKWGINIETRVFWGREIWMNHQIEWTVNYWLTCLALIVLRKGKKIINKNWRILCDRVKHMERTYLNYFFFCTFCHNIK